MSSTPSSGGTVEEIKVKRVGNYLLGRTLGKGSFGKVKLATHTITGEKVAMKILDKDRIQDVADMERITREINVLKLLYHPNVIKLYEVIDTQRHIYIVTEYANGGELFDYIVHHGRLKEKEACRFFHMLMNGVDYCHQRLVIHRDLKPENLLLNSQRTLKIIDFGLSNRIKPGGLLKTACGSPCYAAPEMIEGKMYAGQMSDIWSCGVILFALVCGYLPFEDQNTQALYQKILHARYRCPSSLSSECKHLISKILNTDPTKRFTIAQIRQHPWYVDNFIGQTIEEVKFSDSSSADPNAATGGLDMVIDDAIVTELDKLGFPRDNTIACIKARKHNQVVAAYRLLLEKRMREASEAGKTYTIIPVDSSAPAAAASGASVPTATQVAPGTPASAPQKPGSPFAAATGSVVTSSGAPTGNPVVMPANPAKPADKDEVTMTAAKQEAAQQRRRHSLFVGSSAAPAVTFTAGARGGTAVKDDKGNEIIPATAGSIAVGARPKAAANPVTALAALPDGEEEEDEDAAFLIAQAQAETAKRRAAGAAAGTPAIAISAAPAPRTSSTSAAGPDGEQEMPDSVRAAQAAAAAQAAYKSRRRTSIAGGRDAAAAATVIQQQKASMAEAEAKEAAAGGQAVPPAQQKDVRVFRGLFNVSATSSKPPTVVIEEICGLLRKQRIAFKRVEESFVLKCEYPDKGIRFEIEICKLPRLEEVCFVNMKRIAGETFVWKEFCTQFFSLLQL